MARSFWFPILSLVAPPNPPRSIRGAEEGVLSPASAPVQCPPVPSADLVALHACSLAWWFCFPPQLARVASTPGVRAPSRSKGESGLPGPTSGLQKLPAERVGIHAGRPGQAAWSETGPSLTRGGECPPGCREDQTYISASARTWW